MSVIRSARRPITGLLKIGFSFAAFALAVWVIWREIRDISLSLVVSALTQIPMWAVGAALMLTAISYGCLAMTEVIVTRIMGFKANPRRIALTAISAFAVSNTLGLSLASGGAVRLRGYEPAGLTRFQIARLTLVVSSAVSLSGIVTAGLTIAMAPSVFAHALHRSNVLIGVAALVLVAPAAIWFAAFRSSSPRWLGGGGPSVLTWRDRLAALAAGLGDWAASGAALFILLPQPTIAAFAVFLVVFILGSLVSAASGVPGGLGVFEAVVIGLTPLVAQTHETAAALLVYRLIYSLGPATIVATTVVTLKAGARLRRSIVP
ncbi:MULTISPECIES: hypothetical protein [unclassified Brevundimonas]|uniref:hypothetical protein n=1 Tax=unclassified Brevundimonas TaxID=2622653 RepID=UPI003F935476